MKPSAPQTVSTFQRLMTLNLTAKLTPFLLVDVKLLVAFPF